MTTQPENLKSAEDAIKQAYDAGYRNDHFVNTYGHPRENGWQVVFQDPAFWRALGKARGHEEDVCDWCSDRKCLIGEVLCSRHETSGVMPWWKYYALEYFETLLSEGDQEKYWENLP